MRRTHSIRTRHLDPARRGIALIMSAAAVSACGLAGPETPAPVASLEAEVLSIIDAPPLHRTHWGILVVDAETGDTLFSRDVERHFVPASNQKILVGAASMALLGPDHRFRTEFWTPTPLDGSGVATNGLVLRAGGDPTWSRRFHPDLSAALDSVGRAVAASGLRRVEGGLVVEAPGWNGVDRPSTWMSGDVTATYSALAAPLAVEESTVRVEIATAPAGMAYAAVVPPGRVGVLDARIRAVPEDGPRRISADHSGGRLTLEGTARRGTVDTVSYASPTPTEDAAEAWSGALRRAGVPVIGSSVIRWLPDPDSTYLPGAAAFPPPQPDAIAPCALPVRLCPGSRLLLAIESPPTREIVKAMLEPSQNWIAEQLLAELGRARGADARASQGRGVLLGFLADEVGADSAAFEIRDGSGLSAYNLVTPGAVVSVLSWALGQPWGPIYRDALAAPGEEDSTLENRLEALEGRLEGKTGTITHVNSLSGYLRRDDGRELIFSILTNGSGLPSGTVRGAMDQVVEALARSR